MWRKVLKLQKISPLKENMHKYMYIYNVQKNMIPLKQNVKTVWFIM